MSEATVRALPFWQNEVRLELLSGGLTNVNYLVVDGEDTYAVREVTDDPLLGISRSSELACSRAAARLGIAPRVAFSAPGVLVAEFVKDSEPLTPALLRTPDIMRRAAAAIRSIHDASAEITGHMMYFSPFQVARSYIQSATERGLDLPRPAGEVHDLVQQLQNGIPAGTPTFCHNDMMPGNFLDDGERLWVIDWEYSGIGGYPLFDLAGLSSNCEFGDDEDEMLLEAYSQISSDGTRSAQVGREFQIMKAMAALRESLWAVVHGSQSAIEFDYDGYRDENFAKFLTFRSAALG